MDPKDSSGPRDLGIAVVVPPVTTLAGVTVVTTFLLLTGVIFAVLATPVTTVFFVTTVGVLVVQAVISSAGIAVPAVAEPIFLVEAVTYVTKPVKSVSVVPIFSNLLFT